ncbi:uncharacterized protein B0T23DRAFT_139710 [Neurospora hispaniola]|uniref:Uncharacterized protein n=1 Tax=Neurospora hispaniola TaxID=588809 RepID=A0AAJ0I7K5_9PEZI|nr:hypothetical protein B0T23DRAFT_139710 [Neurospora hispaniola]
MHFHLFTACLSMATFSSFALHSHACNSPFAVPNYSVSSSAGHCYGRTLSDNLTSHLHRQSLFLLFFDKNNKAKGSQHYHHLFLGRINDRRWMLPDKHVMAVEMLIDLFYIIPIVLLLVQDKDNVLPLVLSLGSTFAILLLTRTMIFILLFNILSCFLKAFTLLCGLRCTYFCLVHNSFRFPFLIESTNPAWNRVMGIE